MMKPVVGILMGDATGIGPELVAKVCAEYTSAWTCTPVIIGSPSVLRQGMEIAQVDFAVRPVDTIGQAAGADESIAMVEVPGLSAEDYQLGEISARSGEYTVTVQKYALDLCQSGQLAGVCYAPLNKAAFKLAGYHFDDGMRLMADYVKFDRPYGEINLIDGLWTTRVTSHIPIADVSKNITVDRVLETIHLAHRSIAMDIAAPRIAVAGLNPHNGENGTCGREEVEAIAPAVRLAKEQGIDVSGPFAADTLFARAFAGVFDMVITMYHDQGQIAMKLQDFANIVTLVGGWDYPLATPAHGTAFDIAGKGIANPNPTRRALELVCRMARHSRASHSVPV